MHRLVLPDLQNSHSRHSAVYSGITWSPGATLVTPSPTSTTTPAPSWPSTTGNRPSGSAPDRVKASVWHSAVWVIFTSTSPLRGGSTSISTICSGWSGSKATAARDFMAGLRWDALLEVGTNQRDGVVDAGLAARGRGGGLRQFLAQVAFQHARHQPVDRAAHGGDLLQHRAAFGTGLQRALERVELAADAAHAGQDALFLFGAVGHGIVNAQYSPPVYRAGTEKHPPARSGGRGTRFRHRIQLIRRNIRAPVDCTWHRTRATCQPCRSTRARRCRRDRNDTFDGIQAGRGGARRAAFHGTRDGCALRSG